MDYNVNIDNFDRTQWEQSAKLFADYNIYQTCPYQQIRGETDGQKVSRFIVTDNMDNVVSMGHLRIKSAFLRVGYIQNGPLLLTENNTHDSYTEILAKIKQAYMPKHIDILRIRPGFCEHDASGITTSLTQAGFENLNSLPPYHTIMISLDIPEDMIKKNMSRGWRRNLKRAEQANIEIKHSEGKDCFELYDEFYSAAKKNKGFKGVNPEIFFNTQKMLSDNEKMHFIVAYYDGQPVTVHASSCLGDTAVDILAANSGKAFECGASYVVYWNAFLTAKAAGMRRYDIGGIDPVNNPNVYQFKSRMGGNEAFHIGTFETCGNSLKKHFWHISEKIYRAVKK